MPPDRERQTDSRDRQTEWDGLGCQSAAPDAPVKIKKSHQPVKKNDEGKWTRCFRGAQNELRLCSCGLQSFYFSSKSLESTVESCSECAAETRGQPGWKCSRKVFSVQTIVNDLRRSGASSPRGKAGNVGLRAEI